MTIRKWVDQTANTLADAMIPSARLDAEIILAHTLGKPRTWLHTHSDDELDPRRIDIANARIDLRLERVPVAYIIGHKEFYGRRFMVTTDTLIPRPESEEMITQLGKWLRQHPAAKHLVDVGTGSGVLGITVALEHPDLRVTLTDISQNALKVANKNAQAHSATVKLLRSDLLDHYPLEPDIILANLPYVDQSWATSPETMHEPASALYADEGGLQLIYELINQAADQLSSEGVLILEADPRQHQAIVNYGFEAGLVCSSVTGFIISLER